MSRFIESICLKDGEFQNLEFHQARFERTRHELLGIREHPMLRDVLQKDLATSNNKSEGLFKCRVVYSGVIGLIGYQPYQGHRISSLKLLHDDSVSYAYKSEKREGLDRLFALRGEHDDILVVKKGLLTDSYYANLALRKDGRWYTPDSPLLPGTMRARLLEKEQLIECRIREEELREYSVLRLINAMNPLAEAADIPMEQIF